MLPFLLLLTPLFTATLCFLLRLPRILHWVNCAGAAVTLLLGGDLVFAVLTRGTLAAWRGNIYIDALSAFIILIICFLAFTAACYSVGYMQREMAEGIVKPRDLRKYYFWLHAFVFTMLAVLMFDNLGMMWVAIEATTLASALLVAFYYKPAAVEAAWKYIIICTIGILFALFGTILVYYSAVKTLGHTYQALHWSRLVTIADVLDPAIVKLGFLFVLVGYGTKAGLAPMHTWLPDAHSQAPTPVSALLSGGLLNCAVYAILRFHIITVKGLGPLFSSQLLLIFGLLSVSVAIPFILLQRDLKRLLAYSSVEHMGIIVLGVGIGGQLGLYGAVLHMLNHALAKSAMFYLAGDITQQYRTRKMAKIRGLLQTMPLAGTLLLVGVLAIAGSPPFGLFVSEFAIAGAGFAAGRYFSVALYLLAIAAVFAGFMYYGGKMAFGLNRGRALPFAGSAWTTSAIVGSLALVMIFGVYVPPFVNNVLARVAAVIGGI